VQDCYRAAEEHYPLTDQFELHDQIAQLTTKNLTASSFPSITGGAQVLYFSDVASVAGPVPFGASNDQYKASVMVEQAIYDGGLKTVQRLIVGLQADVDKKRIEVDLHKLREQVNDVYMGALIFQAQIESLKNVSSDLQSRRANLQSLVSNGVLLQSNVDILDVELLRNDQRLAEASANQLTMRAVLGLLIGTQVDSSTVLVTPAPAIDGRGPGSRQLPEYELFELNRSLLRNQSSLQSKRLNPRVGAFAEGAIGRPAGLNLFETSITPFYNLGIRMEWKPWDWRITKREREMIDVRLRILDTQEETLTTTITLVAERERRQVELLEGLLVQDDAIIELRSKITAEAGVRLEQGVLNASQFVTELNAESQARLARKLHELQVIQAKLRYLTTIGEQP
jgi:outer membrane protein TolC